MSFTLPSSGDGHPCHMHTGLRCAHGFDLTSLGPIDPCKGAFCVTASCRRAQDNRSCRHTEPHCCKHPLYHISWHRTNVWITVDVKRPLRKRWGCMGRLLRASRLLFGMAWPNERSSLEDYSADAMHNNHQPRCNHKKIVSLASLTHGEMTYGTVAGVRCLSLHAYAAMQTVLLPTTM